MNISFTTKVGRQLLAAWKYAASFVKREWDIDDYPIWVREQTVSPSDAGSRPKYHPWVASVINWGIISGTGSTKAEAVQDLHRSFTECKKREARLPRPGTGLPIKFAPNQRVSSHAELVVDFTKRVLNLEWAWISDESSLWDFHGEGTNEFLYKRIREVYGVDVSDVSNGNLAEILDRIAQAIPR